MPGLSPSPDDVRQSALAIRAVGSFGCAVSEHLRRLRRDVVPAIPGDWPEARAILLASWRPVPEICESAGAAAHERRIFFVPAILDSALLHLGPVIIPGAGSCWNCRQRRVRQHSPWLGSQVALWEHYDANPPAGPQGYLEPVAAFAAAWLSMAVDDLDRGAHLAGRVCQFNLLTREMTAGTAIGVNGCPRCGIECSAEERTCLAMRRALDYLWTDAGTSARTGVGEQH